MAIKAKSYLGILGGGQLATMLLPCVHGKSVKSKVLDSKGCPAEKLCDEFIPGDPKNYQDIKKFLTNLSALTIEIENVDTKAMLYAKTKGIVVYPDPKLVALIQDKAKQKKFFLKNKIPSPEFVLTKKREDLKKYNYFLPAVHKLCRGGYDGRGVVVLEKTKDIAIGFDAPSVLEKKVDLKKEISVIAVRSTKGKILCYEPTEMVFDPKRNQLDYLFSPAQLSKAEIRKTKQLALKVVKAFAKSYAMVGLLAIEMFQDKQGKFWVNEVAPRPHNSGHHTIEACESSQYEQHVRAVLGMPLASIKTKAKVALLANILGPEGKSGSASWINTVPKKNKKFSQVFIHNYGKLESRPGRKMGHITILGTTRSEVMEKLAFARKHLKIIVD